MTRVKVTVERLGVYRPEEHIDNPKDYADNVDARQYDPRLRGPVDSREIQIDQRTGMKNYIANEQGGWATSTKYIRDSLLKAIDLGRRATVDADRYEALRLLGQVFPPTGVKPLTPLLFKSRLMILVTAYVGRSYRTLELDRISPYRTRLHTSLPPRRQQHSNIPSQRKTCLANDHRNLRRRRLHPLPPR